MSAKERREKISARRPTTLHPFRTNRERIAACIVCIFLAALVWIAFGQTLRHDFVNYDDNDYVWENPRITSGVTLYSIEWAFTHVHATNWHPLTTISHMLDVQLYGLQPWGHHLTNVLLHATGVVLLFLALYNLTSPAVAALYERRFSSKEQPSPPAVIDRPYSSLWPSAFVAALFAVHPLRVESVAWISERKDVLSGVFFMLTLLAYAAYVRSGRDRTRNYTLVLICFALGLMCKPTLVTLPFVLLLLDYWPLGRWQGVGSKEQGAVRGHELYGGRPRAFLASRPREAGDSILVKTEKSKARSGKRQAQTSVFSFQFSAFRDLVVEKIPLFVLSAASCIATVLAQEKALHKSLSLTFIERAANAVVSYAAYLGQMFYPAHLAVLYPYSKGDLKLASVIFDLGLLLALSAIFFLCRRKYPFLLVGWLWYLGMLVPMIGIVEVGVQTRADRYTYLPQIGLYILVAWGALQIVRTRRLRFEIPAITAAVIVIALTACTYHEVSFWKNGETLWRHAISNTSNNDIAHYSLGNELLRNHQIDAALFEFEKALQINPDYAEAEMNVGVILLQKGDIDGAINHTKKAVQIDPNYFEAEYNLGNLLQQRGQPDEAIPHYRSALSVRPNYAEAHNSLGVALAEKGELSGAIVEFEEALRLKPDYAEAHSDLGNALASQHKFEQAIPHHIEALRLNPNSPPAHYNLGYTLLQAGRRDEAAAQFAETLRLNPDYTAAKQQLRNLGVPSPQ